MSCKKRNLNLLEAGSLILDAGCGSQQYRKYCDHLIYFGQDFGKYEKDDKEMIVLRILKEITLEEGKMAIHMANLTM